jgi:hypothetical protein
VEDAVFRIITPEEFTEFLFERRSGDISNKNLIGDPEEAG